MADRLLIDNLSLESDIFAFRWKDKIRKAGQLKHYNSLSDEKLVESQKAMYPLLSRTLDRGVDRSVVGGFFVGMGKDRMREGYPVSEIIYAVSLSQQTVIEYIMNDIMSDNPMKMYQSMGTINSVAEFFFLGCFYITKGFLEETYTDMSGNVAVSEGFLKKYFKDDFFFKQN
jgi:hypothetical protein